MIVQPTHLRRRFLCAFDFEFPRLMLVTSEVQPKGLR